MLVTPSGIVMLVKPLQPENACDSTLVTLSGIVTLVKPLQPENTEHPMLVVPSSTTRFVTESNGIPHCHPGTTTLVTFMQL